MRNLTNIVRRMREPLDVVLRRLTLSESANVLLYRDCRLLDQYEIDPLIVAAANWNFQTSSRVVCLTIQASGGDLPIHWNSLTDWGQEITPT